LNYGGNGLNLRSTTYHRRHPKTTGLICYFSELELSVVNCKRSVNS